MKSFLANLFGRKSLRRKRSEGDTIPLSDKNLPEGMLVQLKYDPPQLIASCGQSEGKQRDHNEDSLFVCTITPGGTRGQPLGLYIVADGMGGHQHGEIASTVAARSMAGSLLQKINPMIASPSESLNESLQEMMREAILHAQKSVMQAAPGSGTTVTAALIMGQQVTIAHIGDSRAYAIQADGRMDVMTRDHSIVKRLEELGQLSEDEAAVHPNRNVLYRALGQGEMIEPDIFTAPMPNPGYILLCSDGLWGVVSKDEIFECVMGSPDLPAACQKLVAAANSAGGPDNITVILIQLLS